MFSALLENLSPFTSNLKLSSANSFNLEEFEICHLIKVLNKELSVEGLEGRKKAIWIFLSFRFRQTFLERACHDSSVLFREFKGMDPSYECLLKLYPMPAESPMIGGQDWLVVKSQSERDPERRVYWSWLTSFPQTRNLRLFHRSSAGYKSESHTNVLKLFWQGIKHCGKRRKCW